MSLFPNELIKRSKELNHKDFIKENKGLCQDFLSSLHCKEWREPIQKIYKRCQEEKLLDKHFEKQAKISFHPRSWELYIGGLLLEAEKIERVTSSSKGPDFIISNNIQEKVYIECVTTKSGTRQDIIRQPQSGVVFIPEDSKILCRISNSFNEKYNKYSTLIGREKVPYIIAINIAEIDKLSFRESLNYTLKYCFAMGYPQYSIKNSQYIGHTSRNQVHKTGGAKIILGPFLNNSFELCSGIIYSSNYIIEDLSFCGDICGFINNPFAKYPIEIEKFLNIEGYAVDKKINIQRTT